MIIEQIKSLQGMAPEALYAAWREAFVDYERSWTSYEFETMLHRRGFVPELSFGAFADGQLIGFTLNGIGTFNGVKTAYDTGTGTIKAFRRKGLATRIFRESLPGLREAGIRQYLLEVLQHNTAAVAVYKNQGFAISRELNYFLQHADDLRLAALPQQFELKEIGHDEREGMKSMWDFLPSWQNSFEAIDRSPGDFIAIGAVDRGRLVGYGIIEPASGDITQLAVNPAFRRQGIGSCILRALIQHNRHSPVKVINVATDCVVFTDFLEHHGIPLRGKQYEMIKAIS